MNKISYTQRGNKLLAIIIGSLALGAIFGDLIILSFSVIAFIILIYDELKSSSVSKKLPQLVFLKPNSLKIRTTAGKNETLKLDCQIKQVKTNLKFKLASLLEGVKIKPESINIIRKKSSELTLTINPQLTGSYSATKLAVEVLGPYSLTRKEGFIPLSLELKAYPRLLTAVIQTVLFLLREGEGGRGETPTLFKGPGTEYADTRAYLPGDTLHHIDWKATARRNELMIKEFYLEAGEAAHIIYDARVSGPIAKDKLATAFLSSCLALAEQRLPLGITIHDGENIKVHLFSEAPTATLKVALQYVLEAFPAEIEAMDTLLEPVTSSQLKTMLHKLKSEFIKKILQIEAENLEKGAPALYKFLKMAAHKEREAKQFLLITQLSRDLTSLLNLIEYIKRRHRLTIIQPTQPWIESQNLEDAYNLYQSFQRTKQILARQKIPLVTKFSF